MPHLSTDDNRHTRIEQCITCEAVLTYIATYSNTLLPVAGDTPLDAIPGEWHWCIEGMLYVSDKGREE